MVNGGLAATTRLNVLVTTRFESSVTLTEKVEVPDAVGVPESTPDGDRDSPAGRVPEATAHVYDLPPVATSVVE
jgi:hypothetical protein